MLNFLIGFLCGAAAGMGVSCLVTAFHSIDKQAAKLAERFAAEAKAGLEEDKEVNGG